LVILVIGTVDTPNFIVHKIKVHPEDAYSGGQSEQKQRRVFRTKEMGINKKGREFR